MVEKKNTARQDPETVEPLTPEELAARRAWYREYRKANPAKAQQWEKNRWAKKVRQMRENAGKGSGQGADT